MPEQKRDFAKQGKKNRAAGARFELKVREHLENLGWIVSKWANTVDYEKWKLAPVKPKYNPFRKAIMVMGTGFPDFVAFRRTSEGFYEVMGIEVKRRGYLTKIEKDMCTWLLEQKIFSRILIAKAVFKGRKLDVDYDDFTKNIG